MGSVRKSKKSEKDFQELAEDIKSAILTGELQQGQRLVESRLCEVFKTKRNRIRNALRKLEHEGFVTITPNVGAKVAKLSRSTIDNTFDIISALDALAVRLATPFITPTEMDILEGLLQSMEKTEKITAYAHFNDEFHTFFSTRCENPRLIQLLDNLRKNINFFGHRTFVVPGQIAATNKEHREIVRAIRDKKAKLAEQLMRDHVIDAKNRLLAYLRKHAL